MDSVVEMKAQNHCVVGTESPVCQHVHHSCTSLFTRMEQGGHIHSTPSFCKREEHPREMGEWAHPEGSKSWQETTFKVITGHRFTVSRGEEIYEDKSRAGQAGIKENGKPGNTMLGDKQAVSECNTGLHTLKHGNTAQVDRYLIGSLSSHVL